MIVSTFGFSAGSYTAIVLHRALTILGKYMRVVPFAEAGAIALPPYYLTTITRFLTLIHYEGDKLCIWKPTSIDKRNIEAAGIVLWVIMQNSTIAATLLGSNKHTYRELLELVKFVTYEFSAQAYFRDIPLTTLTMLRPVNLRADIGLSGMGFMVIGWFVVMLSDAGRIHFFDKLCSLLKGQVYTENPEAAGGDLYRDMGDRITAAIAETLAEERCQEIGVLPLTTCVVDAISKTLLVTPRPALEYIYQVAIPLMLADGSIVNKDPRKRVYTDNSVRECAQVQVIPVLQVTDQVHVLKIIPTNDYLGGFAQWQQPPKGAGNGKGKVTKREAEIAGLNLGDIFVAEMSRNDQFGRQIIGNLVGLVLDKDHQKQARNWRHHLF
jgi:hypothetical protein